MLDMRPDMMFANGACHSAVGVTKNIGFSARTAPRRFDNTPSDLKLSQLLPQINVPSFLVPTQLGLKAKVPPGGALRSCQLRRVILNQEDVSFSRLANWDIPFRNQRLASRASFQILRFAQIDIIMRQLISKRSGESISSGSSAGASPSHGQLQVANNS